jgi:hypothetical protein
VAINIPLTSVKAEAGHDHGQMGKMNMKMGMKDLAEEETLSLEKIHSMHLPMVSQSIDKAIKAVESGDKIAALVELRKARTMIAAIKAGVGNHVKPEFANVRCPIMGSPIKTDKVADNLVREYKGEKIAFCCGGCPSAWDKLPDAERQAKLAKSKPAPITDHSGHMH